MKPVFLAGFCEVLVCEHEVFGFGFVWLLPFEDEVFCFFKREQHEVVVAGGVYAFFHNFYEVFCFFLGGFAN